MPRRCYIELKSARAPVEEGHPVDQAFVPQTHQAFLTIRGDYPRHDYGGAEMMPDGTEINSASARVEGLGILALLPATALLTSKEAALYINTTAEVLRVWRSQGKGPRFKGRGHFVRYLKSDLDDFMSGFDHRFDMSGAGA